MHGTSHFSQLLLAPLFPVFIREFGLSFADVGLLMTVFFVISGIGQALAGFLVDRVGARPVLFGAVGMFFLAAVAASQVTSYAGLMLVAVLAGTGNAPLHPCDFTILNQRVSLPRLGHAFSAHGLTGNLGWALAPALLVGVSAWADWRVAYQVAAVLYLVVLGVMFWQRDKLRTEVVVQAAGAPRGGDLGFLKLPVVWWCFAFFLLSTMSLAVVQSFAPSILKAMPFQFLAFYPASVLLGKESTHDLLWNLGVEACWCVAFFIAGRYFLRAGLKQFSAFGG